MGGDHAPDEVVAGRLAWAAANPDTDLLLVGDAARIEPLMAGRATPNLEVVHASESVGWTSSPPPPSAASATPASTSACASSAKDAPTRS